MPVLLTDLSSSQLSELIAQASKRRKVLSKRKPIAVVRRNLEAAAKASGYSIAELFDSQSSIESSAKRTAKSSSGSKVAPKYRNPNASIKLGQGGDLSQSG